MGKTITTCCHQQIQPDKRLTRVSKPRNDCLSTNGVFSSKNFSLESFFAYRYLGKGIYGCTTGVFCKENKAQKLAQKIVSTEKLVQEFAFLHEDIVLYLKPPNFIDIKLWTTENEKLYIFMEKMEIGDLFYFLKKQQRIDDHNIRQICRYVIQMLSEIHCRGFICRNLRPQNILITSKEGSLAFSETLFCVYGEKLYSYFGCATYTPPEVYKFLHQQGYDKSIDIWMFGIMLYEILFKNTPFQSNSLDQIKKKVLKFKPQDLDFSTKEVSQQLVNLMILMLNPNPRQRITLNQIKNHKFMKIQDECQRAQISLISLKHKGEREECEFPKRVIFYDFTKSLPLTRDFGSQFYEDSC